jgi:hypothetical protein
VGRTLRLVRKGRQIDETVASFQGAGYEPVGQYRVFWQQRPVEVATNGVAIDGALGAISPVVAATDADAAHRLDAWSERGQSAVVLEPD